MQHVTGSEVGGRAGAGEQGARLYCLWRKNALSAASWLQERLGACSEVRRVCGCW